VVWASFELKYEREWGDVKLVEGWLKNPPSFHRQAVLCCNMLIEMYLQKKEMLEVNGLRQKTGVKYRGGSANQPSLNHSSA
jgi:hypothetical protein